MSERKYTIAEIERMRAALRFSYPSGVSFYERERSAEIENRLRTYMQNGTSPEELEALAEKRIDLERRFGPGVQTFTYISDGGGNGGSGGVEAPKGDLQAVAITMTDTSAKTFGKYQYCTMADDGLWYSDEDMRGIRPRRGALPSPRQEDPRKQARADAIIRKHAEKIAADVLPRAARKPPSLAVRVIGGLLGRRSAPSP